MKTVPLLILASVVVAGYALAAEADPEAVPARGTVAPAFGLHPLNDSASQDPVTEELDSRCGTRPGATTGVLVLFVDESSLDDLSLAQTWERRYAAQGLEILAISTVAHPASISAEIEKAHLSFPVLDDRYGVVAHRYGVLRAPFSFLLDQTCRVLGFSNRRLSEDGDMLSASIAAQVSGQLGRLGN